MKPIIQGYVCRACLGENTEMKSLFIFENNSAISLLDMFISCTSLDITENDQYPKYICTNCIKDLSKAFAFRTKCQNSIENLNKLSNDLHFEHVVNIEVDVSIVKDDPDTTDTIQFTTAEPKSRYKETGNSSSDKKIDKSNIKKEKSFACIICKKLFDRFRYLKEHKKTHNIVKTCRRCNLYFETKQAYRVHERTHAETHNKYLCTDCGRVFKSRSGFVAHRNSHSNAQPHECKTCGNKFKSGSSLKVHMRKHSGELLYACEQCDKKFMTWHSRSLHIIIHHSDARPHVCGVCNKAFKVAGKLTIHMRQHTGERPYQCPECSMTFSVIGTLKRHMATHTGEKPIACAVCPKRFVTRANLKQHMVTHTGERKHGCEVCGKTFTQAHVLRSHMRTHHSN